MEYTPDFSCLEPLLNSNTAPLPPQVFKVTEVVGFLPKSLEETEARIARLQTELAQLETTKSTLREDIQKSNGILSPLRHIPPETIQNFMLGCVGTDAETLDSTQAKNVALVSREWYQIAIGTPVLWSSYVIDTQDDNAVDEAASTPASDADVAPVPITFAAAQVRKASAHLAKAASLPLRLRCNIACNAVDNDVVLDYIHSLSPRTYCRPSLRAEPRARRGCRRTERSAHQPLPPSNGLADVNSCSYGPAFPPQIWHRHMPEGRLSIPDTVIPCTAGRGHTCHQRGRL